MDNTADNHNRFPVTLSLRIDWAELDLFGHVNNVMFMKYVQAARVNYWEQIGLYQDFLKTRLGPMLASVSCNFRKPMHYPGTAVMKTRMKFIGNTSFSLEHQIFDDEGDLCAEAQDVMVVYNFNTNTKQPFPEELKAKVTALEGREIPGR